MVIFAASVIMTAVRYTLLALAIRGALACGTAYAWRSGAYAATDEDDGDGSDDDGRADD